MGASTAAPDVLAGLWADPQAWVHQCSGTTQAAPGVGWGRKPQEAGASAERHAVPDGEQSLAPRPGHVASPGAGWAGGPPLCPGEQTVEAASVWADRPVGCMHALLPHALQCADGPASRPPPQPLRSSPGCPGVHQTEEETEARDGRDPAQDAQPPDAQTACSWTHPCGDPNPGLEKVWVPSQPLQPPRPRQEPRPQGGGSEGLGGLHRAPWFIDQRQPSIC